MQIDFLIPTEETAFTISSTSWYIFCSFAFYNHYAKQWQFALTWKVSVLFSCVFTFHKCVSRCRKKMSAVICEGIIRIYSHSILVISKSQVAIWAHSNDVPYYSRSLSHILHHTTAIIITVMYCVNITAIHPNCSIPWRLLLLLLLSYG